MFSFALELWYLNKADFFIRSRRKYDNHNDDDDDDGCDRVSQRRNIIEMG